MKRLLIDSDVILDFFFDREPFAKYASYVLSELEQRKSQGYVTPVIISNVYYLLRKNSTHNHVIKKLNQLMTLTDILLIDKQVVLNAMNSKFRDYEDALQNYACEHFGKIDLIVTRNIRDFQYSEIGILTPEQFYKLNIKNEL